MEISETSGTGVRRGHSLALRKLIFLGKERKVMHHLMCYPFNVQGEKTLIPPSFGLIYKEDAGKPGCLI